MDLISIIAGSTACYVISAILYRKYEYLIVDKIRSIIYLLPECLVMYTILIYDFLSQFTKEELIVTIGGIYPVTAMFFYTIIDYISFYLPQLQIKHELSMYEYLPSAILLFIVCEASKMNMIYEGSKHLILCENEEMKSTDVSAHVVTYKPRRHLSIMLSTYRYFITLYKWHNDVEFRNKLTKYALHILILRNHVIALMESYYSFQHDEYRIFGESVIQIRFDKYNEIRTQLETFLLQN